MFFNKAIHIAGYLQLIGLAQSQQKADTAWRVQQLEYLIFIYPISTSFSVFPHIHPTPAPLHEIWTDCPFTTTHFLVHTDMKKPEEELFLSSRFFHSCVQFPWGCAEASYTLHTYSSLQIPETPNLKILM